MKVFGWFFVVTSAVNLAFQLKGIARPAFWGHTMGPVQGLIASVGLLIIGVLMIRSSKSEGKGR